MEKVSGSHNDNESPHSKKSRPYEREPDPTALSALTPKEPLTRSRSIVRPAIAPPFVKVSRVFKDDMGNEYVEINSTDTWGAQNYPMRQRVVASILKGIINVSDVIPARKRTLAGKEKVVHVSRILPLNAITSPSLRAERLADMFILSVIFFDYDKTDWPLIRSNTRVNQDNKTAYFDFGKAELFMPIRSFGRKVAAKNIQSLKSDVRAVVAKKLEQLRDRCATEEGQSFLRAIIKEVAKADPRASAIEDVDEKIKLIFDKKAATVNVLQDMLLQRIEAYLKAIEGLNEVH